MTLIIAAEGREDVIMKGLKHHEARVFCEELKEEWIRFNLATFENKSELFDDILAGIRLMVSPRCYPAACVVAPLLDRASELDASLLSKLDDVVTDTEVIKRIKTVRKFVADPVSFRASSIDTFVDSEMERWSELFDTIETRPLTPEQRLSVVVDEDATLVLAGAGSGKTSVITSKAAYLVKAGIRKPEEILLLAFAKNAAEEMSERVENRSGVPITARTFHAIAYDIVGVVEGSKPALADHATDDMAFINLIKQILKDLVQREPDVSKSIIRFFAHFLVETKTEWDFETKHDYYKHLENCDLRTLQGERVKSYEELQIANWLYENGVEYEYEPDYKYKIQNTGKRDYLPDFRLTDSDIYIEHFGVRRRMLKNGKQELTTAPIVDHDKYLAGMEWKRKVHARYQTLLVETYSYERQEGVLLTNLAEKLTPHVTFKPRSIDTIYDRIVELGHVDDFSKLLGTFLRQFKSGGYSLQACESKAKKMNLGDRAKAFLDVFASVFKEYQKRLGGRIDFEDMIIRAAHYAENGRYVSPFLHILIDEFQDISQSRARLVKALKAQHPEGRIFAVGDDWQSIFRFAGSDIHLMRRFGAEFGGTFHGETGVQRTVDLGRTFRSVDQIAFAARNFVLQNPHQIKKQIVPAGTATKPAIRIVYAPRGEDDSKLVEVLSDLSASAASNTKLATVLLLGRYRFVRPDIDMLKKQFDQLNISFKTIHASKGLEADHIILLNVNSGRMGFPSEIVDDPLLSLVSPEEEIFENAEERRVMYVAMTRARYTFTIIASYSRPSSFVVELESDADNVLADALGSEIETHICGECGGRLLRVSSMNGRTWYRCEHVRYCGNILPACHSCGTFLPRRVNGLHRLRCDCGAGFPACLECEDGWLVERDGPYGRFLGCVRYPSCSGKAKIS